MKLALIKLVLFFQGAFIWTAVQLFGELSLAQEFAVPFEVPKRSAMVVGVTNLEKLGEVLNEAEPHFRSAIPLLLCTDPHNGEELKFENRSQPSGAEFDGHDLEGASLWIILDDSSENIGELAILFYHPNLKLDEQLRKSVEHFSRMVFSFLPRLFGKGESVAQGKFLDRLIQWERNHTIEFRDGCTFVFSSQNFVSKLVFKDSVPNLVAELNNRSFADASKWVLPNSDLVCYFAPTNAKAFAAGTGFVQEWIIREHGYPYAETPWSVFSVRVDQGERTRISYRHITRSTLPLHSETRLWDTYRKISWLPQLPHDFTSFGCSNRDLRKYEEIFREIYPDRAEMIKAEPVFSWDYGFGRTQVGGLSINLSNRKLSKTGETLDFANWKMVEQSADKNEIFEICDRYYASYVESCYRVARPSFFGHSVTRQEYRGFPAWFGTDESGDPRIAVLAGNALYEGPQIFFEKFELTDDGNLKEDVDLLKKLEIEVQKAGLEGSIVAAGIDKFALPHMLAGFYLNQVLEVFNEHNYLGENDFVQVLKTYQPEGKTTRYQKLRYEAASALNLLRSKRVEHLEISLYDPDTPVWKVMGHFEIQENREETDSEASDNE